MGGLCSKNSSSTSSRKKPNPYASANSNLEKRYELQSSKTQSTEPMIAPQVLEKVQEKEEVLSAEFSANLSDGYPSSEDEFYDGIPRFRRSSSQKSRSRRMKVSEVSSLLGKASSVGVERAIGVLDTLGSSMSSFNPSNGFLPGVTAKNNELSILSFEVANTIVKGSSIMQSLSRRSIRILKEVVFPSQGVQQLVSTDTDELLKIVAVDIREQLKIFSGEVVRFGNRCKDPQWHNLDRFFKKNSSTRTPQKRLGDEAELMMQQLMILVRHTAELYQELHRLDRVEQDYQRKHLEESVPNASQRGCSLSILAAELKTQRKLVQNLKKKSLWSRSLEEVVEKIVDIVLFLNQEISDVFGNADDGSTEEMSLGSQQKLGSAGLSLHYANIILLIDLIVARSSSIPSNVRENLYQSLPPNIKSSLRSKVQSFHIKEEFSITEVKAEMEKTLHWLVPIATKTAKSHHGFGWVGEWANTRSESNRQSVGLVDVFQIETLHHASRQKIEAYILELLVWLNYLVRRSKVGVKRSNAKPSIKSPSRSPLLTDQQIVHMLGLKSSPTLDNQKMLQDLSDRKQIRRMSRSLDIDSMKSSSKKLGKLRKSHSFSSTTGSNELIPQEKPPSTIPIIEFGLSKEKNILDRVETRANHVVSDI